MRSNRLKKDQSADLLVPYGMVYNRRFGFKCGLQEGEGSSGSAPVVKRMKRDTPSQLNDLLSRRQVLDRRRLEEGFLLFACLEVINSYGLVIEHVPCNRNELAEMVSGKFRDAFVQKWGDHVCNIAGCSSVLVLDGNMKNSRQVCACRDVGELKFAGLEGSVVVGCQNTPAKGLRYCDLHKDIARQYVDDGSMGEQSTVKQTGNNKENDLLIVQILNEKETRQGGLFEVMWSDGRKSWIKESNMPKRVLENIKAGKKLFNMFPFLSVNLAKKDMSFNSMKNTVIMLHPVQSSL